MGAEVVVDELVVRFPGHDRPVVDGVTLTAAPGEVVAVLGPSGCGKTTVLRVIAGLQALTSGTVRIGGDDLTATPAHLRGVGLMFQDHALFPHRDVGQNVEFGLRMQQLPTDARRARVAEVLELVGLAGWERRAVATLSGGEQQRVALARALAPSPRVLLLDEPFGSVDRALRDQLVPELGALFRQLGTTVVQVTHDQTEALALADRVLVMTAGRVVQAATPAELWARPHSALVARFLGFTNVTDEAMVRADAVGLTVVASGDAPVAAGAVRGVVEAVAFRGDRADVHVGYADGSGSIDAEVSTRAGLVAVGDVVEVMVDPRGRWTFPVP